MNVNFISASNWGGSVVGKGDDGVFLGVDIGDGSGVICYVCGEIKFGCGKNLTEMSLLLIS